MNVYKFLVFLMPIMLLLGCSDEPDNNQATVRFLEHKSIKIYLNRTDKVTNDCTVLPPVYISNGTLKLETGFIYELRPMQFYREKGDANDMLQHWHEMTVDVYNPVKIDIEERCVYTFNDLAKVGRIVVKHDGCLSDCKFNFRKYLDDAPLDSILEMVTYYNGYY